METQNIPKLVEQLKSQIDCLLIRVNSCQQFIEKLFALVGHTSSPQKNKSGQNNSFLSDRNIQIREQSGRTNPKYSFNSPVERSLSKNVSKTITLDFQGVNETEEVPSMKDFFIFQGSKSNREKYLDTNSFTLIKNAILINSQQIQNVQQEIGKVKQHCQKQYEKSQEVLGVLTRVVYQLEEQVRVKFSSIMGALGISQKRGGRSIRKNREKYNNYEMVSM